jgi:hypothetical protein
MFQGILPLKWKEELDAKFILGNEPNFRKVFDLVVNYANGNRVAKNRGPADMDVDSVVGKMQQQLNEAQKQIDYMNEYWEQDQGDEQVDYMGKGKGKGKKRKNSKGNSKGKSGGNGGWQSWQPNSGGWQGKGPNSGNGGNNGSRESRDC